MPGADSSAGEIVLPVGALYYTNHYRDGNSRTDIWFQAAPGINVRSGNGSASLFSREGDKALYLFEGSRQREAYPYTNPQLTRTNETKQMYGKPCTAHVFTGADSLKVTVWFSKGIPGWVSPGLRFPGAGGVAQVDYFFEGKRWSLALEEYRETDAVVNFKTDLPRPASPPKLHFLFASHEEK